MARSAPVLTKTVSEANFARLDEARLVRLLLVAAEGDAGFKRRLRLELLMSWGALREAAGAIEARPAELVGAHSDLTLWASRIAARHPAAAARLLQVRARVLAQRGSGHEAEREAILAEAEALTRSIADTTR